MKLYQKVFVCALAVTLLLTACESRTLAPAPEEPVIGESVVEETPQFPEEPQEPTIPEGAPGFYETRQEMNGWEVFSLSTAQDLVELSSWLQEGQNSAHCIFQLQADIDLSGIEFIPIGTKENPFQGTFLGQGYSVSGLSVTSPNYGEAAGLFGYLNGALVDSLHVSGTVTACQVAGGLAGSASDSTIQECSFNGSVYGMANDIGGLCGSAHHTEFYDCSADADVTGQESLGGFAGVLGDGCLVKNCSALGQVSAANREYWLSEYGLPEPDWGTQPDGEIMVRYIGGFVGMNIGSIQNCLSMGAVKALETAKTIGGFVGYESGSDAGCYYFLDYNAQWQPGYAVGDNASLSAQGLYYDRMATRTSFEGWDFDTTWQMGQRNPELMAQSPLTAQMVAGVPDPTAGLEGESTTPDENESAESENTEVG